ncbi:MAG: CPBP family intramembrane glutamic endopeptidase [Chloroflexota bacterium]
MLKRLLGPALRLDWKIAVLTISTTLLIMVDQYHQLFANHSWESLLLYFAVPLLIVLVIFREPLSHYGFTFGDWKAGLAITGIAVLAMLPILWWVNLQSGGMQDYYAGSVDGQFLAYVLVDLFGWEFMFRGFLLFGYARKFGPEALWLQAVPFAVAHIGKPEVETLSTIFGGFAFGWVAWRTKSFLYPWLIHFFVWSFTVIVTSGLVG